MIVANLGVAQLRQHTLEVMQAIVAERRTGVADYESPHIFNGRSFCCSPEFAGGLLRQIAENGSRNWLG